jgi:CDP-diacylglycerol--serine O-phosphatidyltransferase
MVSRLRYWSFKAKPESERVPFIWIPLALGIIVLLVVDPPRVLLGIAVVYVLHGPLLTLWGMRKRRERPAA